PIRNIWRCRLSPVHIPRNSPIRRGGIHRPVRRNEVIMSNQTLAVTGASGKLGRRAVEFLLEAKAGPIVAITRTPEKIADLAARGVTVRKGDFDDPAGLEQAFGGAQRALIVSGEDIMTPGRRLRQHQNAVASAAKAGVQHAI